MSARSRCIGAAFDPHQQRHIAHAWAIVGARTQLAFPPRGVATVEHSELGVTGAAERVHHGLRTTRTIFASDHERLIGAVEPADDR